MKRNTKVLIVTGFAPVNLPQLKEMGIPVGPISYLSALAGKPVLQFTIPTVAPAVLAAFLAERNLDVRVTDCFLEPDRPYDADIVGISSTFMGVEDVKRIAVKIKTQNPRSVAVLGGPLAWSLPPADLLRIVPEIDFIVLREGEQTFIELIDAIESGDAPDSISGLAFLKDGALVETQLRKIDGCAAIKRPDWKKLGIPSARRLPVLPVETSRGCPFNCAYCSEVTYWDKPVRYRPITDVVEEIVANSEELGINTFRFTDSCFSAPPERCGKLCDAIYERANEQSIPVKWSSYARINNLDSTLLEKMKRSGCVALDIGIESGSTEMLRSMGRNYSPETACAVAKRARELGIITNLNVVIGFPGETQDSIKRTAELIDRAQPDTYASFLFYLAPHTAISRGSGAHNLTGAGLNWRHDTMTSEQAAGYMAEMETSISNSTNFPGGEYMSCYMASVGYTYEQISLFYRHMRDIPRLQENQTAMQDVREVVERISRYW